MDKLAVFQAALGIGDPWKLTEVTFDSEHGRLDMHLDFSRGARFSCPESDSSECPVYDTEDKTWRHLNLFQHQTYLHARIPRVS